MEILELSTYNSKENTNNSTWTNTFSSVKINTGDEIGLKTCFIDLKKTNAQDNITIENDINLTMTFGYYQNYLTDMSVNSTPVGYSPNGLYHIARELGSSNLLTTTKTYTLQKGNYTPEVLGELLTRKFTELGGEDLNAIIDSNNFLLPTSTLLPIDLSDIVNNTGGGVQNTQWTASIITLTGEVVNYYVVGQKVLIYYIDGSSPDPIQASLDTTITVINSITGVITVANSVGVAANNSLYDCYITLKGADLVTLYNPLDNNKIFFNEFPTFIGSNQVSLVYNLENSIIMMPSILRR